jgi:hypothetical protein
MTHIPFLFHQTLEQMRRVGARGGKAHARNWQARQRAAGPGPRATAVPVVPPASSCWLPAQHGFHGARTSTSIYVKNPAHFLVL